MTDNLDRALRARLLARSQVSPRDVESLRAFARSLPARRPFWRRPMVQWALPAAALVFVVVVALPALVRGPWFGTASPAATPTPTPASTRWLPTTTPEPPITPWPEPEFGPIELLTASGSRVPVVIHDPLGILVSVHAEQGGSEPSVGWREARIESVGPRAIRVTWIGFPQEDDVRIRVSFGASVRIAIQVYQDTAKPDGAGEDRVLVFEFDDLVEPFTAEQASVGFADHE